MMLRFSVILFCAFFIKVNTLNSTSLIEVFSEGQTKGSYHADLFVDPYVQQDFLLQSTVPIEIRDEVGDEVKNRGTGFLAKIKGRREEEAASVFLITNTHVIETARDMNYSMSLYFNIIKSNEKKICRISCPSSYIKHFSHDRNYDVTAIRIGYLFDQLETKSGSKLQYRALNFNGREEKIAPRENKSRITQSYYLVLGSELMMIGYPDGKMDGVP